MKIGVTIPNNWGIQDPHQVLEFGPLAENLGYDSVSVSYTHLTLPTNREV